MSSYTVRFAEYEDIPAIMGFIEKYWKSGHILAVNRGFFEFQHLDNEKRVNFGLAVDNTTDEILCICGFIQSCEDISKGSVWTALWKKRDGAPRGIGVEVMDYIAENSGALHDFSIGARPAVVPILKERGCFIANLRHYYRLNSGKEYFNIALIEDRKIQPYDTSLPVKLTALKAGDVLEKIAGNAEQKQPYKDYWYISKRYIDHPVYKYDIWGLEYPGGNINSILITRVVQTQQGSVLRIIDYIGNHEDMSYIGPEIDRLIINGNHEYTDMYCYGVKDEYIARMGFIERLQNDVNIIPNHFEPFERKNAEVIFYSSLKEGFTVFKGDGDQDRPSKI